MDDFRRDRAANHGQAAGGGMADRNGVIFESAFYHKLYDAAMKRGKLAPLFDRQTDRGAMIRLRTLQHMNVIHLRMRLAQEVAAMKRNGTTDYDQMEHVSRLMKRYSMSPPPPSPDLDRERKTKKDRNCLQHLSNF